MTNHALPRFSSALPFWLSLSLLPLAWISATMGGWTLLLLPAYGWMALSILDIVAGNEEGNLDPETPETALFWYRLITLLWFPVQALTLGLSIWWMTHGAPLALWEKIGYMAGIGVVSGAVGIVYAHELMHQKNRLERWLADLLLATVLYSHYRSEHLLVHHRHVATPRDAVSARYNEGFHRVFARVLLTGLGSAWRAERQMLARAGRGAFHRSNPFWRYAALSGMALGAAWLLGGWLGVGLFALQALVAVWQLELVNYIEHYGLTRRHLGEGKYEPAGLQHSWNANHKVTSWFLINVQRHSDHHLKPDRRYPLLQHHQPDRAPLLPYSYPVMTALALVPPLWRRVMNPRVRAWRQKFYPDISDWKPYNRGQLPLPRGAS